MKPVPTIEMLSSAVRSAEYNSEIEAQRDSLALQVGRLCRWAVDNGMKGLDCPKP